MPAKATAKQVLFVSEYLVDLNATQAAIRAGYSKKTAQVIGAENLAKPIIATAICKAFDARAARTEITQDEVMAELARIGFADIRDLFEWDEERVAYVPSENLTADQAAAIAAVEASTVRFTDKEGNKTERIQLKLKTHDKLGALEKLGRHLGMFVNRHEHTGPGGGPIMTVDQADGAKERLFDRLAGIAERIMERLEPEAVHGNGDGTATGAGARALPSGPNGAGAVGP